MIVKVHLAPHLVFTLNTLSMSALPPVISTCVNYESWHWLNINYKCYQEEKSSYQDISWPSFKVTRPGSSNHSAVFLVTAYHCAYVFLLAYYYIHLVQLSCHRLKLYIGSSKLMNVVCTLAFPVAGLGWAVFMFVLASTRFSGYGWLFEPTLPCHENIISSSVLLVYCHSAQIITSFLADIFNKLQSKESRVLLTYVLDFSSRRSRICPDNKSVLVEKTNQTIYKLPPWTSEYYPQTGWPSQVNTFFRTKEIFPLLWKNLDS